ncbi:MAG TPA: Asp-tRNA(Asn)/Glu-tRNA(Gln) amidotransferase subunit GatA [Candidatus Dojkabacteria bacterium]|jgi:aspartyl-tRNA(Asn)/glutamyl-tRNA(Gln) amidotransferase subunit A
MEVAKLTIKQTRKDLDEKKYSSKELTEAIFERIEKNDNDVKAFISNYKEEAMNASEEFDSGKSDDSKIAGIPVSLKDNYNWKGSKTTASSNIIKDYISPYNATVTERLVNAGAVITSKANMDAFAHGSSTETSDFFTSRNPWDLSKLPGGSSGGSAAAVASGMSIYSMGSETAGSVRGPASWCGLTGLKPTYGRSSRYGIIAMGSSLDVPGPITKSVEDAAIVLEIIAGQDPRDATTSPKSAEKYFENLSDDLMGMKIGVVKQYFDEEKIEKEVLVKVHEALATLEKKGAKLIDIDLMDPKYGLAVYTVVCRSEVSSNLGRYDGIRYGHFSDEKAETMLDQIALNRGEGFGNEAKQRSMTGAYALSAGYYDAYYKKAQQVRTLIIEDMNKAFDEVDVLVGPTMASTALEIGATEGNPLFGEMMDVLVMASSLSGTPGLSVPVGFDSKNLPVGLNIMAPQFEEQRILNLGYAYQNETDWHTKFPDIKFDK